ncbi:unnamed protein product, partial [Ectocarpus sp. 13 AM-2016]
RRSSFASSCVGTPIVNMPQNRLSASPFREGGGEQEAAAKNVGIEVFAHGALGTDALLVASLSNSALLILRIGSDGIRSWLLDWPVAGKIRGMCVSPDLQCVLCATDG